MKLSIIIPVYQVKNTLRRCVESVLNQSFRDWQILLIDDASTDGSSEICDELSYQNQRIQVIHLKQNSGLSAARNAGLKKAKGEYITFIDSDDFIANGTLKELMEEIVIHPDYDILEYPIYEHFGSQKQLLVQFSKHEYTDMKEYWLKGKAYKHTYAWNKIYRRELWIDIRFPEGKIFEDAFTLPQILKQCNIIATTDVGLYYYCHNASGITQKATAKDLTSLLETHVKIINELNIANTNNNLPKHLEVPFADYYAAVLNIMLDIHDYPKPIAPHNNLPPSAFPILPYKHTLKLKLLHLLGIKHLCQLHRIFHKVCKATA